jgi:hypothetical protein
MLLLGKQESFYLIGFYLNESSKPLVATSGCTIATYFYEDDILGSFPTIHKFINGIKQ